MFAALLSLSSLMTHQAVQISDGDRFVGTHINMDSALVVVINFILKYGRGF